MPARLEPSPLWIKSGRVGNKLYLLATFYFVGITIYALKIHEIFALGHANFTPQNQRHSYWSSLRKSIYSIVYSICYVSTRSSRIQSLTTDLQRSACHGFDLTNSPNIPWMNSRMGSISAILWRGRVRYINSLVEEALINCKYDNSLFLKYRMINVHLGNLFQG